eukprot:CAMPEP_0170176178 /NCGR_PEP_ID=MMETSP0040_2-20121228/9122_1 /TAXON_ID=641309 /ORGANISM="Lotharella oceanica, Strain CCMP622" /LENGTH=297 /DNA_ID=CAMNT_0010418425 /DNA_START=1 /DNA_END=895 /DNA_ORIENTATION=+
MRMTGDAARSVASEKEHGPVLKTAFGRAFFRGALCCFDVTVRVVGPIMFVLVWAILGTIVYAYFVHYCPLQELDPFFSAHGLATTVTCFYLIGTIIFHHLSCALKSPKYVTKEIVRRVEAMAAEEGVPALQCRFCRQVRPRRAKHCHTCKKCVLKMDHHCPWMCNCVGVGNYHHFFLFLVYATLGCYYLLWHTAPILSKPYPVVSFKIGQQMTPEILRANKKIVDDRQHFESLLVISLLIFSAGLALTVLTILHIYLLLSNQTTYDSAKGQGPVNTGAPFSSFSFRVAEEGQGKQLH